MGALTSKPFSFTARSWELSDRTTVDFNDTFFSTIKVSFRGGSIIRILPEFTNDSLSEWISDRIRFSYDVSSTVVLQDHVLNFKTNFSHFWITFFSKRFNLSGFFNQSYFDLSTTCRLKSINYFTGASAIPNISYDFRKLFSSNFSNLSKILLDYRFFYFIGINIRYTIPVLSISLRKLNNESIFFNIGFFTNNLLGDVNLGFSSISIFSFFRSSSRLNRFFISNLSASFIFSVPHFSSYIVTQTKYYLQPHQLYFFFARPFALSAAEVVYKPLNSSCFKNLNFFLPHPFSYVTYQFRCFSYQRISSLYSNIFYGNFIRLFNKVCFEYHIFYFSPVNNSILFNFSINNFYSHFFDPLFNRSSLNILVSLRRQQDLRSSFNYYN